MPGESAEIGVKYDTKRVGKISKSIIVTSNAKRKRIVLKIAGNVLPANKPANNLEKPKSLMSAQ